jgi:hypothetical protein
MNTTFELAVEKTGPEYLALESDLRRTLRPGSVELESVRKDTRDPIAHLLAMVLVDWAGPKAADFNAALEYLDRIPRKGSIIQNPPPVGVEGYLTREFANRVANLLALRLVKQPDWPGWKAVSVVLYLKTHKMPSTTAALIRYAITTTHEEGRKLAIEAIQAIKDPDLSAKLGFELARAQALGLTVPPDVRAL